MSTERRQEEARLEEVMDGGGKATRTQPHPAAFSRDQSAFTGAYDVPLSRICFGFSTLYKFPAQMVKSHFFGYYETID